MLGLKNCFQKELKLKTFFCNIRFSSTISINNNPSAKAQQIRRKRNDSKTTSRLRHSGHALRREFDRRQGSTGRISGRGRPWPAMPNGSIKMYLYICMKAPRVPNIPGKGERKETSSSLGRSRRGFSEAACPVVRSRLMMWLLLSEMSAGATFEGAGASWGQCRVSGKGRGRCRSEVMFVTCSCITGQIECWRTKINVLQNKCNWNWVVFCRKWQKSATRNNPRSNNSLS